MKLAAQYPNPALALESLDGIRDRVRGSQRFNRMMSSWAFRQLADFILYKAQRAGVRVVFVDPRNSSRACPRCKHTAKANRPEQSHFRCVACGYQGNADVVASINIAGAAARLLRQGPTGTARPDKGQPDPAGGWVDGVKVCDTGFKKILFKTKNPGAIFLNPRALPSVDRPAKAGRRHHSVTN
ncbi:zinc ribbon domain-containing protein [Calidithermus timidus]|uniref:zinc ribbon domain-containing protein n=1 Tax=Calidithermus timidus TaxID=307124 RepID=UPI001FDF4C09|nr:zinc ribbon domain-containing protein [Calidithermus timidus]